MYSIQQESAALKGSTKPQNGTQGRQAETRSNHLTTVDEHQVVMPPVAAGHVCIEDTDHMVSMMPPTRRTSTPQSPPEAPKLVRDDYNLENGLPSGRTGVKRPNLQKSNGDSFLRKRRNGGLMRNGPSESIRSLYSNNTLVSAIRDRDRKSSLERGRTRLRKEASLASIVVEERELGGRIKRTSVQAIHETNEEQEQDIDNKLTPKKERLFVVGVALFSSLALAFVLTYLVLKFALEDPYTYYDKFVEYKSHQAAVRDTVPFVEKWYRDFQKDNEYLLRPPRMTTVISNSTPNSTLCLEKWFDDLESAVPNTDPALMRYVLQNMGLEGSPLITAKIQDLLVAPQTLKETYDESRQCLALNPAMVSMACILHEENPWNLTNDASLHALEYVVNFAAVQDTLTKELEGDPAALNQVIEIASGTRYQQLEHFLSQSSDMTSQVKDSFRKNYQGILQGMQALVQVFAGNDVTYQKESLQLQILQGVKIDLMLGHEANARIGVSLAASVRFDPYTDGNKLLWLLGEDWVRDYVGWKLTLTYGSSSLTRLPHFLIPTVTCANSSGENVIAKSITSAGLDAMHLILPPGKVLQEMALSEGAVNDILSFGAEQRSHKIPLQRFDVASTLGESNLNHTSLLSPSHDTVQRMLYTLCGGKCYDGSWSVTDTSLQSNLDDEQFRVYVGFIVWITVLIAGLGMELLVWLTFLRYGWSKKLEDRWRFAQFVFPVLAATTLGLALDQNYLALPFLVLGLWKFGFPETLLYMYMALYDVSNSLNERMTDFINAVGTIVHHGAASFLISMLLAAVFPPDRHFIDGILILLMQHWFVLLAYVNRLVYIVLELVLEAYFEWTVISNMQYLYALHWTASLSAGAMLVAHWLYLMGAGLDLVGTPKKESIKKESTEKGNSQNSA